jgi:hypothetical protein
MQARREKMRILIHREHRHPMRDTSVELQLPIGVPDRIRKRTAAGDDQEPLPPSGLCDNLQGRIEMRGMRQQSATDFDDEVHERSLSHLCN